MQVQALPGASVHDGRERVEREDRGELRLSAGGTDVLVLSDRTEVVARDRVKLLAELHRSGVKYCCCRVPRDISRKRVWESVDIRGLEDRGTGTCA